jgi:hypothetical protein
MNQNKINRNKKNEDQIKKKIKKNKKGMRLKKYSNFIDYLKLKNNN